MTNIDDILCGPCFVIKSNSASEEQDEYINDMQHFRASGQNGCRQI